MTTRLSNVFDDEILKSKKQVGCIGGIFQLFDCQQLLGQGNRRDASGHVTVCPSNRRPDFSKSCSLEKKQIMRSQENPRDSLESSRTSFSSSFTTFSSIGQKSPQEEQIYTQHSFYPSSPRNSPRSPAFKDAIKESIYKDFSSGQTINDDGNKINRVMKHVHSPRSVDICKFNDHDESLTILFKLKEAPRFSYDGSQISQSFIDMKQESKQREFSRLSLDSKEDSLRSNLSPKFSTALKKLPNNESRRTSAVLSQQKGMEINQKNPTIVAKLMGLEPLDESKYGESLQSPRNTANVKQQAESLMEKKLKKDQYQYSVNELKDLKCEIIEARKNDDTNLSSVNSQSARLTPWKYKLNKANPSEGAFKSSIVDIEPARKSDVSFSQAVHLEGQTGFANIRTSSSNNQKDRLNAQINTISPRLQQIKSDKKKKATDAIPHNSTKFLKPVNSQTSNSVPQRCKLKQKSSMVQGFELQNSGDQVHEEAYRGNRPFKHKSLFKQSIQASTIKFCSQELLPKDKIKDLSTKELKEFSPHWPSPKSVLDALLKQDSLPHFPVSISTVFREYQGLPSDHGLNMLCIPHAYQSNLSFTNNLQKQDSIDSIYSKDRVLERANEELHESDAYPSGIQDKHFKMSNPRKLRQKLISDVMDEILEQKISSPDYKVICHQICCERKDDSLIHTKFHWQSQVWNSLKNEVPMIVLEMERLIFKDLINEVVHSEMVIDQETKQKQPKVQLFARNKA